MLGLALPGQPPEPGIAPGRCLPLPAETESPASDGILQSERATSLKKLPDRFHLGLLIAGAFGMDLTFRAGAQAYQESGLAFQATALQLGLLGTVSAVCYSSMCVLAGSVSDRIGRRAAAVAATVGLAIAYFLAGRATSIHQLLGLTVLSGSSLAFFWPATQAWIADLGGRGRRALTRNLGLFNIFWSAGLALGPSFTGYLWAYGLADGSSQHLVFSTVAGFSLLLGGLVLVIRTRGSATIKRMTNANSDETPHPHASSFLRAAWVGTFASWFAVGVIGSLFPKLGAELGYNERMRGLLASSYHLGQVVMFVAAFLTARWQFRRWPLGVAEGCALLALISVIWANTPLHFALSFCVAGLCSGIAYVGSLFYSLHGRTERQGRTTGLHEAILGSGVFLGPLTGGLVAQHISLRGPFVLAGIVFGLAILLQLRIWSAIRRARAADQLA